MIIEISQQFIRDAMIYLSFIFGIIMLCLCSIAIYARIYYLIIGIPTALLLILTSLHYWEIIKFMSVP